LTALLRILDKALLMQLDFAMLWLNILYCLIDEDVAEHVKVHHSPRVQVMLWHRHMVSCEVLLTAIMLCLLTAIMLCLLTAIMLCL